MNDLIQQHNLIDASGRVNGPKLKFLEPSIIKQIESETTWLDAHPQTKIKHRIRAIYLNITEIPECDNPGCANFSAFNDKRNELFSRFCSCQCAGVFSAKDSKSQEKLASTLKRRMPGMLLALEKGRITQQKKFGGHGFQRQDVQQKISRHDEFSFFHWKVHEPTGIRFQGFEDIFIDSIIDSIDEFVFVRKDIPHFDRYIPDCYHPESNTIFEIKGVWTLLTGILEGSLKTKIKRVLSENKKFTLITYNNRRERKSWQIDFCPPVLPADVESILGNYLTSIYHTDPHELQSLGRTMYQRALELLDVQTD